MDDDLLDRAVEELYAGDLADFTARRTELAKQAKGAGDAEAAKAITALRKPTQAAYTINRLARTDPAAIAGLIDVGSELRQAQRIADAVSLRELNTQRKRLLDALIKRAFDVLGQQSPSAGQREEVTATLQAALADPDVAAQLQQGILVRAAEPTGFGFSPPELSVLAGGRQRPLQRLAPVAADGDASKAPEDGETASAEKAAREATAKERKSRADAEKARREAALDRAKAAVEEADADVHDAVAAIEAAEQRIRSLQHLLTEARRELAEEQARAKTAEERQRKARQALHKVGG